MVCRWSIVTSVMPAFLLVWLTSCKADLEYDYAGNLSDYCEKAGKGSDCSGNPLELSFITEDFSTNVNSVVVKWNVNSKALNYELKVANEQYCSSPIQTFRQFDSERRIDFIEDGIYYFCVAALLPSGQYLEATNNGLAVTVDTTKPKIKVASGSVIEAAEAVNPEFTVEDMTKVTLSWSAESEFVYIGNPDSEEPSITFTRNGLYDVTLKALDAVGNSSSRVFQINWIGGPENSVALYDYDIRFHRTHYQSRSIKYVLIDPRYTVSQSKLSIHDVDFDLKNVGFDAEDRIIFFPYQSTPLKKVLPYGNSQIDLVLLDGLDNKSIAPVIMKDFDLFAVSPTSFSNGEIEFRGLSGGISSFSGSVKSGGSVLTSGFTPMINH